MNLLNKKAIFIFLIYFIGSCNKKTDLRMINNSLIEQKSSNSNNKKYINTINKIDFS